MSSTFKSSQLEIITTLKPKSKPDYSKPLIFGEKSTDYIFEINHNEKSGWDKPVIKPIEDFEFDFRNSALQNSVSLFEGLKAYRTDKNILLFRPMENLRRLLESSKRLGLPSFDKAEYLDCLKKFIYLERDWIPTQKGYSIYIRPTFISMDNSFDIQKPKSSKLFTVLTPVAGYFSGGYKPLRIICNEDVNRSHPKGFGYAKIGANYGPTLNHYKEIKERGYDQILWLNDDVITEVGVMNFFLIYKNKLTNKPEAVTASLDNQILGGITRLSILELLKDIGIKAVERTIHINEFIEIVKENRVIEAFGCGTAAVISPIKSITYKNKEYVVSQDSFESSIGYTLKERIESIQLGKFAPSYSKHKWLVPISLKSH